MTHDQWLLDKQIFKIRNGRASLLEIDFTVTAIHTDDPEVQSKVADIKRRLRTIHHWAKDERQHKRWLGAIAKDLAAAIKLLEVQP